MRLGSKMLGLVAAPDACYKALRDMRTVALRMQQQDASARTLARWLQQQSEVRVSAATGSCNSIAKGVCSLVLVYGGS